MTLCDPSKGIAPHKDTFYTVPEMPDNGLGWPENHSDMHCAVATLTTGPVTFGDKPGLENRDLLMKCCRDDGKILKPDRAISAIDSQIRNLGIVFNNPKVFDSSFWLMLET